MKKFVCNAYDTNGTCILTDNMIYHSDNPAFSNPIRTFYYMARSHARMMCKALGSISVNGKLYNL